MKIVRAETLTKRRWKNGGGTTTEIAREGGNGLDDFSWRVSYAEISSHGPFSEFLGYDRALIIWNGKGIRLHGAELHPFEPFYFSGNVAQDASLIDGPVIDLGCIYKQKEFACELSVIADLSFLTTALAAADPTEDLVFIVSGDARLRGEALSERDTFHLTQERLKPADISISSRFLAIRIAITSVGTLND